MIACSLPVFKSITRIIPLSFLALVLFLLPLSLSLSIPSYPFELNHSLTMPGKRNLSPPPSPSSLFLSSLESSPTMAPRNKKLRRLPHVFSKFLELPFDSEADISIEDLPNCLRFVADGVLVGGEVRAHVIKVHPGVTKVVIRSRENRSQAPLIDDPELNLWRFRLPPAAKPELAKAVYGGRRLVVTVPKHGWGENKRCAEDFKGGSFRGDNMGSLVV